MSALRKAAGDLVAVAALGIGGAWITELARETWSAGRPYLEAQPTQVPLGWGGLAFIVAICVCLIVGAVDRLIVQHLRDATHRRILAEGQERARQAIDDLTRERDLASRNSERWQDIAAGRAEAMRRLSAECAALSAEVERLTPKRDALGHYIRKEAA